MTLRPARLSDCRGLGVLLAFRKGDDNFLIIGEEAVIVDEGERAWRSLALSEAGRHVGLLVGDVRIEVDIQSSFDPDRDVSPGALVRHGNALSLWTAGRLMPFAETGAPITIVAGESDGASISVGFTRWSVVKGEGDTRKTILSIDADRSASSDESEEAEN